jgi:glycine cleavage system pyridoxal-binding protein P
MINNNFARRHNGPFGDEIKTMLEKIGVSTLDQLIYQTDPS